jgi:hypothetical protein
MALGSTQPLSEMSTRNLPGGKGRPARKADLTTICEPSVYKMWEPRRLTTLWAFTACYGIALPYLNCTLKFRKQAFSRTEIYIVYIHKRRWEDNIKMHHREIGWGGMDWIDLAQDRGQWRALVKTVMNLRIP